MTQLEFIDSLLGILEEIEVLVSDEIRDSNTASRSCMPELIETVNRSRVRMAILEDELGILRQRINDGHAALDKTNKKQKKK